MPPSESHSHTLPDLDLEACIPLDAATRNRPCPRPLPPAMDAQRRADEVTLEEADRAAGIGFLLTALPTLADLASGQGFGGMLLLAIPLVFGVGLLRRDGFVEKWVRAACFVQIILGPLTLFLSPASALFVLGGLAGNIGLLVLVSARSLRRRTYRFCLAGIAAGLLCALAGALLS